MVVEQLKEIQSLKKRLFDLESKINSNFKAFGRSYSSVGSPSSDLLIHTRGQVKIQWGSKFIDLIKDGKINADSKFIYKENQVGVKDGIYVVGEGDESQVVLKIGDTKIDLVGKIGTTYVSFQGEQKTTAEQKYTALTNIGFLYKSIEDINTDSLQNGIVYIESEQKLYIIHEGILSEFTLPNIFKKQFILQKSDSTIGSIVIVGDNIENSLAFNSLYLYTSEGESFFESKGDINFKINDEYILLIRQDETTFNSSVSSKIFKSIGANNNSGFRLYISEGKSVLEVDNIISRNNLDLTKNLDDIVVFKIGYLEELQIFNEEDNEEVPIYGIYSQNAAFLNAQYTKDYNLQLEDKSTKLASTEWVHNLLPKGATIMFGDSLDNIPEGWSLCDGSNNTPNLTEKFIKSGDTYSLVYIMKII